MSKIWLVLLSALIASSVLQAQTRCTTDVMGNTTCRDNRTGSGGGNGRSAVDSFGDVSPSKSRGGVNRGSSDSTNRDIRRDSEGGSARRRSDSLGNTIYRDNRGSTVRCGAASVGDPNCR